MAATETRAHRQIRKAAEAKGAKIIKAGCQPIGSMLHVEVLGLKEQADSLSIRLTEFAGD